MYKKNLLKATSVFTAFALACSTMAMSGCGLNKKEDTVAVETQAETGEDTAENAEADELVDTMTKTAYTGSSENAESGKEETVYVMTDASGNVDDVVVSNWLKNKDGSKTLTDKTNLKDIVNVKGEETYTENSDGTVTWDAEGSDIYYQGTPTEEVPIGVKVTYTLNGKEMTADEIAGQSGSVKIRFDYTNTLKKEVNIDGQEENIDVPFTMISGTMLDSDKFANVKVSNGKVISDANNYVVVGVAMPGLKESLKIDDEKLKENDIDEEDVSIPDYVEITADVNDFELPMTISMASANVVSDLGLDKIYNSDKVDTLNDDMDKLSDASTELRDGTGELADGTGKFQDGTTELANGTSDLKDGTKKLKDGTTELKDGTTQLRDGAGTLASGAGTLADGTNTLSVGVKAYTDGVGTVASGASDLKDGVATLAKGSKDLTGGITSAKDGAEQLSSGANQLSKGIGTLAETVNTNLTAVTLAESTFYSAYKAVIDEVAPQDASASSPTVATTNSNGTDVSALISSITDQLADVYAIEADIEAARAQAAENRADQAENRAEEAETRANDAEKALNEINDEDTPSSDAADDSDSASDENSQDSSQNDNQDAKNASDEQNTQPDTASDENNAPDNGSQSSESTEDNSSGTEAADNSSSDDNGSNEEASQNTEEVSDSSAESTEESVESPEAVSLDTSSEETVDGTVEYANDAGWAAVESLTKIPKAKWDAMYQAVITAKAASGSDEQVTQLGDLLETCGKLITKGKAAKEAAYTLGEEAKAAFAINELATGMAKKELAEQKAAEAKTCYTQALTALSQNVVTPAQNATQYAMTIYMAYSSLSTSKTMLDQLYNGVGQGGLKDIKTGAETLAKGTDDLYIGLKKLDKGGTKFNKGIKSLKDGSKKLSSGAALLSSKGDELKNGAYQLSEGAGKLASGATELSDGTIKLDNGVGELNDGVIELDDGAGKLYDGANELKDGAVELNDGAKKLADGMVEFDEDGIQKLTSTVDEDLLSVKDRLRAVDEASQSYTSFSGANEDEPSSVQFIIRTAGISSDED
jgi:putative membrane protein